MWRSLNRQVSQQISAVMCAKLRYSTFVELCATVCVDTLKRQTPRHYFNLSEQCLTCQHLQMTSRRQADDQFLLIPEGQSSDLDPTDPVKQTVG